MSSSKSNSTSTNPTPELFDVIVGNPPWVQFTEHKDYYKQNYEVAECGDLYGLFIERGVKLLKPGGYLGFIVPSLFIKNVRYEVLRKFILNNTKIIKIREMGDCVFEGVQMPSAILILKKEKIENQKWEDFLPNNKIVKLVENQTQKLDELVNIMRGLEIGKNKLNDSKDFKILAGQDISRYSINHVSFISNETYNIYKKNNEFFEGQRLYIRETGERLTCIYLDDDETLSVRSLYSIKAKNESINLKFILGVINSQIIQDYYSAKYKADTNIFPKIRIEQVRQLPIPTATQEQQAQIAELVDEIMELKKEMSEITGKTLRTIEREYKPKNLGKKLQEFYKLDFGEFITELEKQKVSLTLAKKEELEEYFEERKARILEMEKQVEVVDREIEERVRGLYGVMQ